MQQVHSLEAAMWGVGGAIIARVLGMNHVVNEEARKQRYKKKGERRSRAQIVVAIARDWYFWATNAAHLSAAVFVILLFIRDGIDMTARLAVFIGAAAPALLGDLLNPLSSSGGALGPSPPSTPRRSDEEGSGPSS